MLPDAPPTLDSEDEGTINRLTSSVLYSIEHDVDALRLEWERTEMPTANTAEVYLRLRDVSAHVQAIRQMLALIQYTEGERVLHSASTTD